MVSWMVAAALSRHAPHAMRDIIVTLLVELSLIVNFVLLEHIVQYNLQYQYPVRRVFSVPSQDKHLSALASCAQGKQYFKNNYLYLVNFFPLHLSLGDFTAYLLVVPKGQCVLSGTIAPRERLTTRFILVLRALLTTIAASISPVSAVHALVDITVDLVQVHLRLVRQEPTICIPVHPVIPAACLVKLDMHVLRLECRH